MYRLFIPAFVMASLQTNAQQLYISPGNRFVLNGNIALVIKDAALNNNGTIIPTGSTVYFGGYADTTVSRITGSSRTTLTNLSINKQAHGVAVKSAVDIANTLNMLAGKLYPDSNLRLKSTAANTARVTSVPPACNIVGKAIVERYIPARRAWRLLTAPVKNAGSIYNTWQNAGVNVPGIGMYVTGPGPTGASGNGLDSSNRNNPSMYRWNISTQSYVAVSNTHVSISGGSAGNADNTGYLTFVRGDRVNSNFAIPNSTVTTLVSSGELQTGNQVFTASAAAGGYTLVGNPYASPIDFNSLARTNLIKRFYVWDPMLNTLGGYVMLDDLDNDGNYTKTVAASNQGRHIQSGQAFLVQTMAASPATLTVAENCKSSTNSNLLFRPATEGTEMPSLRITLNLPQADGSVVLADETLAEFDADFSDAVTTDDALKFANVGEEISFTRFGKTLTAERRPLITVNDTLFIKLNRTGQRNYQMILSPANMQQNLSAFLEDNYLQTSKLLNLTAINMYDFTVTADAASTGANRFRIVFKQGFTTLPVSFISLTAGRNPDNTVQVKWTVTNEINVEKYEVEISADGNHFTSAGFIAAGAAQYYFTDLTATANEIFYRIKSIDKNGTIQYSNVIKVAGGRNKKGITVYPAIVTGNTVYVQFADQEPGKYLLQLFNMAGQKIVETNKILTERNAVQVLTMGNTAKGIAQLKITAPDHTTRVVKIMLR